MRGKEWFSCSAPLEAIQTGKSIGWSVSLFSPSLPEISHPPICPLPPFKFVLSIFPNVREKLIFPDVKKKKSKSEKKACGCKENDFKSGDWWCTGSSAGEVMVEWSKMLMCFFINEFLQSRTRRHNPGTNPGGYPSHTLRSRSRVDSYNVLARQGHAVNFPSVDVVRFQGSIQLGKPGHNLQSGAVRGLSHHWYTGEGGEESRELSMNVLFFLLLFSTRWRGRIILR